MAAAGSALCSQQSGKCGLGTPSQVRRDGSLVFAKSAQQTVCSQGHEMFERALLSCVFFGDPVKACCGIHFAQQSNFVLYPRCSQHCRMLKCKILQCCPCLL